jgi:hypothetical protein
LYHASNELTGSSLLCRIKAAIPERNEHINAFQELNGSLPPESVASWKEAIEAWEQSKTKKNPFELQDKCDVFIP